MNDLLLRVWARSLPCMHACGHAPSLPCMHACGAGRLICWATTIPMHIATRPLSNVKGMHTNGLPGCKPFLQHNATHSRAPPPPLLQDADPYDFSDPVDVVGQVTKVPVVVGDDSIAFWACFESKKWNVRKAALDKVGGVGSTLKGRAGLCSVHCAPYELRLAMPMAEMLVMPYHRYQRNSSRP